MRPGGLILRPSTWTPLNFGTDLGFWLNASQNVTKSGTDVTAWRDQSSYANNALTVSATKPQFLATGINNLPAIVFTAGTGNGMEISAAASLRPTAGITLFCVVRWPVRVDIFENVFVCTTTPSLSTDGWGIANPFGAINMVGIYVNDIGAHEATASGFAANTDYILTGTFDGSTLKFFVNGTEAASTAYSATITYTGAPKVYLGAAATYNDFSGRISQMGMIRRAITAGERHQLERGYLGPLYNIPVA